VNISIKGKFFFEISGHVTIKKMLLAVLDKF